MSQQANAPRNDARLTVVLQPEAAAQAGARWSVNGAEQMASGETVAGLEPQRARVSFAAVPGWSAPSSVAIWVFNGVERTATAVYTPLASYMIGEIPELTAFEGQTLRFQVYSSALGSSAAFEPIVVQPRPKGTVTTHLHAPFGVFEYTPHHEDHAPLEVTFSAREVGLPHDVQQITITPIPTRDEAGQPLQEAVVFHPHTGTAAGGDSELEVIIDTREVPEPREEFNTTKLDRLRTVTINGEEVVFEPAVAGGLYERFCYAPGPLADRPEVGARNADIHSLHINADRVVIRGPLRLPRTQVSINALELRFEDGDDIATLCTTALSHSMRALDAVLDESWDDAGSATVGKYATRDANGEYQQTDGRHKVVKSAVGADGQPAEVATNTNLFATDERSGDATSGAPGEPAGAIRVNVAALHCDPYRGDRFVLEGGRGQNGGGGKDGRHGTRATWSIPRSPIVGHAAQGDYVPCDEAGAPDGGGITHYKVTDYGTFDWNVNSVHSSNDRPYEDRPDADFWPGHGERCYPPGEPGDGGVGGDLYATFDLTDRTSTLGGRKGLIGDARRDDELHELRADDASGLASSEDGAKDDMGNQIRVRGGRAGFPNPVHRIEMRYQNWRYIKMEKDGRRVLADGKSWSALGESWYRDVVLGTRAAAGRFHLLTAPFSFLEPAWVRQALSACKRDYLFGDMARAETRLSKYAELIDAMEAELAGEAELGEAQIELLALRDEMRSLLNRMASNLDYFGNPAGWVPMLSFEVNRAAFKDEIGAALKSMYLAYWVSNAAKSQAQRHAGLEQLLEGLANEVSELTKQFEDFVAKIATLETRAQQVQDEALGLHREMLELTQKIKQQAQDNLHDEIVLRQVLGGAQFGLRICAIVMQAVPIGQPALGAVGGVVDIAGKFDIDNLFDSGAGVFTGGADVVSTYFDKVFKERSYEVNVELAKAKLPKSKSLIERQESARKLASATAGLAKGVSDVASTLSDFKVKLPDVNDEISRLIGQSDEYAEIGGKLKALARQKAELMGDLAAATVSVTIIPNIVTRNLLAMNALQRDLEASVAAVSPSTMGVMREIDRRARERLLKYHYYMAKAYEYRVLKPYKGRLNMAKVVDKIVALAEASGSGAMLAKAEFESLESLYENELRDITNEIVDECNANVAEKSNALTIALPKAVLDRLNHAQALTMDLVAQGYFPPWEEGLRLRNIRVKDIKVHLEGTDPSSNGAMHVDFEHAGVSKLVSKGEVYQFRHFTGRAANPIKWSAQYTHARGECKCIEPSEAAGSLLRSLVKVDTRMLLFSRPGVWADLIVRKRTFNLPIGSDLVLDSLALEVEYDFVSRPRDQVQLHVMVGHGDYSAANPAAGSELVPYVDVSKADRNGRGAGSGGSFRCYDRLGEVTLVAQQSCGAYRFEKWTGQFGADLPPPEGGASGSGSDTAITVELSDHRTIRAQYRYLAANLSLGERHTTAAGD